MSVQLYGGLGGQVAELTSDSIGGQIVPALIMPPAVPLAMFPILSPSTPTPTGLAAIGDITESAIDTQEFGRNSKSLRMSVSLAANQAPPSRVAVIN
ncbi:hypothetical protein HK405_005462 [Cladochytrium tenue]|nr:hypothetical protein HK405_005462 [Cladochytrium tenue]